VLRLRSNPPLCTPLTRALFITVVGLFPAMSIQQHTKGGLKDAICSYRKRQRRRRLVATIITVQCLLFTTLSLSMRATPTPMHTSKLQGEAWIQELLSGHPDRIASQLGVSKHVFLKLVEALRVDGMVSDSKYITLEVKVASFLYTCVTGLPFRHTRERFQRSGDTLSKQVSFLLSLCCMC
jgi:hypothetical protein